MPSVRLTKQHAEALLEAIDTLDLQTAVHRSLVRLLDDATLGYEAALAAAGAVGGWTPEHLQDLRRCDVSVLTSLAIALSELRTIPVRSDLGL